MPSTGKAIVLAVSLLRKPRLAPRCPTCQEQSLQAAQMLLKPGKRRIWLNSVILFFYFSETRERRRYHDHRSVNEKLWNGIIEMNFYDT